MDDATGEDTDIPHGAAISGTASDYGNDEWRVCNVLVTTGTIENSRENTSILWWCACVRTFVQFAPFVTIRDLLVLILCQRLCSQRSPSRMARINEWHESSKSAEITGFLDRAVTTKPLAVCIVAIERIF